MSWPKHDFDPCCIWLLSISSFAERLYGVNNQRPFHHHSENVMKYICLGYIEEKKWETLPESERNTLMDECFAYDDELKKNGHFVGGEARRSAAKRAERYHAALAEWQSRCHRRPVCRNEGAIGWTPRARGERFESCHPIDVKTSRRESWPIRDSTGGRYHGNRGGKRTAAKCSEAMTEKCMAEK